LKILIDIGHPAHVHLFKHFAWQMENKGNKILFTVRDKEFEIELLKKYGFSHRLIGKHYNTKVGKILGLIRFDLKLLKVALDFKPDIFLSHGSIYAAQISWLLGKPHIALEDTGNMEQVRLYRSFSKIIFTPRTLIKDLGPKQIKIDSYHEIAYLHPKYFQKSDKNIEFLKTSPDRSFCIIRLVSWNATHDSGKSGLPIDVVKEIVKTLYKRMDVYISSERVLGLELERYKFNLPPDLMHNAIAHSSMVISEGATMAAESGFLGIPTIYINSQETCNNKELEANGCVFYLKNRLDILDKINLIINEPSLTIAIKQNAFALVSSKINLTEFLIWFIDCYPESLKEMKSNPDYQYKFR
jgi:uncharacterized protein